MGFATAEQGTPPPGTHAGPPARRPVSKRVWAAGGVIVFGLLLAAAGIAYLIYAELARSRLDEQVYEVPALQRAAWLAAPVPDAASGPQQTDAADAAGPDVSDVSDGPQLSQAARLYPARWTNPRYWDRPEWAGAEPYGSADLPPGFVYVNAAQLSFDGRKQPAATTLSVPAIGLTTTVYELSIKVDGDRRLWENPIDVAGHIPGTSNPGETGAAWYFGHLESPVRGEGNVFHRLPDIVGLLRDGPVDIIVGSEKGDFLYRVTGTGIKHRDDLELTTTTQSTVTLVASFPPLVYDSRLLVTGELLAYRPPDAR